jgi:hypothetical protein
MLMECSAMNPAREVKTERFSRPEGKTPAFVEGAFILPSCPLFMDSSTANDKGRCHSRLNTAVEPSADRSAKHNRNQRGETRHGCACIFSSFCMLLDSRGEDGTQ